jgi:hypothetical protein
MEDKKQDVNSLEELVKEANAYSGWFAILADELSKVLDDIQTSKKEEDTWEMKCPYKIGDEYYYVYGDGCVRIESWDNFPIDISRWRSGNTFPTKEEAELEAKRRNLLTRFRAFIDECNRGLSVQDEKWEINHKDKKLKALWVPNSINGFPTFGYFKNREDAERAIDLFGDEIKELFVDCEAQ